MPLSTALLRKSFANGYVCKALKWWYSCGLSAVGAKRDGLVSGTHESRVADGDSVSVATEVSIDLIGAAEGAFGVGSPGKHSSVRTRFPPVTQPDVTPVT